VPSGVITAAAVSSQEVSKPSIKRDAAQDLAT